MSLGGQVRQTRERVAFQTHADCNHKHTVFIFVLCCPAEILLENPDVEERVEKKPC